MALAAIIGAGPLGGAIAHAVARRGMFSRLLLIDDAEDVARGKALDILQAGPLERFDTRLDGTRRLDALPAAALVFIADRAPGGGEWSGEAGLALMSRIVRGVSRSPIVFSGAMHGWLIERTAVELGASPSRLVGTAALAFEAAIRTLVAVQSDVAVGDVDLRIDGQPPERFRTGWQDARVAGEPAAARLTHAEIRAIEQRAIACWPPGHYALASASAAVGQAIVCRSHRQFTCASVIGADGERRVVSLPVRLGPSGIIAMESDPPSLNPLPRSGGEGT
jgi:malate dehydrogenase